MVKTGLARGAIAFLGAAVLGGGIWALSPTAVGRAEPWDAPSGVYYFAALFLLGLSIGAWSRRLDALLWVPGGAWLGQAVFMLAFLPTGPLVFLGLALLAAYLPAVVAGVGLSLLVHRLLGIGRARRTAGGA